VTGLPAVISLRGVSLSFGAVRALVDVDLDVRAHEVVAVVGDNGAGKSTLVGVLAGVLVPDTGEVVVEGQEIQLTSPGLARHLGIATVFQDLALCEHLDVVENLFLGQEIRRGPFLDEVAMEREAWQLLGQLAVRLPSVRAPVSTLSGGQRQAVAVQLQPGGQPGLVLEFLQSFLQRRLDMVGVGAGAEVHQQLAHVVDAFLQAQLQLFQGGLHLVVLLLLHRAA